MWLRSILVIVFLLIGAWASGCAQVTVTSQEPVPDAIGNPEPFTPGQAGGERAGVIVLGIDFDPPLRPQSVMAAGRLTLLVVVENLGSRPTEGVVIEARLTGPTDSDLLMQRSLPIAPLAPGETRIVSFDHVPLLPARSTYLLSVTAIGNTGVDGEGSVVRNSKFYRFDVSQSVR